MFVPKMPPPFDFCGQVGCPLCYDWTAPNDLLMVSQSGMDRMAQGLTGKLFAACSAEEQTALRNAAQRIHSNVVNIATDLAPAPPVEAIDVGMDDKTVLERWLKQTVQKRAPNAAARAQQLTCDEIQDRVEEREKQLKAKEAVWQKRKEELNELADAMVAAEREAKEKAERSADYQRSNYYAYMQQLVPEPFIRQCMAQGFTDPAAVVNAWNRTPPYERQQWLVR